MLSAHQRTLENTMQFRRLSGRKSRVASFLYRVVGHVLALVMAMAAPVAHAADAVGANRIVIDGRTQTQMTVNGRRTDIRTRTISGGNAFNSFSHFQTGQGTTVNLHLPGQAKNLINVVRDSPTVINGTLNGYQNGKIGGNIYFATPNGFVVGKSGVVNVGALTVTTPSRAFTESLIGPGGQINDANMARLMSGSFPVSPDGNISIMGRINALSGVKLVGQSIHIHGPSRKSATVRQTQTFAATVNSSGLEMGGAIEVTDGGIEIVAAGKARIGGRLKASRKTAAKAPRIEVRARDDILIEGTAGIVVESQALNYDGGDIIVFSDNNLVVEDGAHFSAAAGATGDGGFIELSGLKTVSIGSAEVLLNAPGGEAGTLLIDPEEIEIVNTVNLSPGSHVTLQATRSITVTSTGAIDTRVRTLGVTSGNSGNIKLEAPSILIEQGGRLLAHVDNAAYTAGDISLIASQSDTQVTGKATADASIIVDGTLRGANIEIKTLAKAESSYNNSAAGIALLGATAVASGVLGLNGGYNAADANSVIRLTGNADIAATGDVTINARGQQEATAPVIAINGLTPIEASVMYGDVDGTTTATIENGATISVGGDLSVIATNDAELSAKALTIAIDDTKADGAAAYGEADISTSASIQSGADITMTNEGNVVVFARNENDFKVSATVQALGSAKAGLAIAISETNTSATAHLGADLGTAANKAGTVIVEADSETERNVTSANTTVGDSLLVTGVRKVAAAASEKMSKLSGDQTSSSGADDNDPAGSSTNKLGAAVAIANSTTGAHANIAADAGHAAPTIVAAGDVAVYTGVRHKGVRNNASSSINSEAATPTPDKPAATNSISSAVAVGNFTNNATSYVGEGVTITGRNIGVGADTRLPITVYDFKWNNTAEGIGNITSVLNANGGIVNNLLTSYANATTKSTQVGLAGAINHLNVTHNTTAWVARNATLIQSRADSVATPAWVLPGSAFTGLESKLAGVTWNAPVAVTADSRIESINIGGNYSWLTLFGVGGQSNDAKAVGGAVNINNYQANTIAGIGDGVSVTSNGDVAVRATSDDRIIAIAPTSGEGDGIGGNGVLSIASTDNTTRASVSNEASVNAARLAIKAGEALAVINIAGAVTAQGDGAVGIGVAVSSLETDTAAYIGDNSADIAVAIDPNAGLAVAGTQKVTTDEIAIQAATAADVDTIAVAGSHASDKPGANPGSKVGKVKAAILSSKSQNQGTPANYSLSASGSSAANDTSFTTHAFIDGATIESKTAASSTRVSVRAVSKAELVAGSGAAAIDNAAPGKSWTVAIAGAIAVGISENETTARISNSSLTRAGPVDVQALAGGEQTIVGLGLAVNLSADLLKSRAAAGSVSISEFTDRVDARIENSTLDAANPSTDDIDIAAYQTSDIGVGAGSLYFAGKSGFGLAITYAMIGNPDGHAAAYAGVIDSAIDGFSDLNVAASESGQIGAGGATGGYSANGYAGAIVVADISSDTKAEILGTAATPKIIDVAGILVSANGERLQANDAIIDTARSLAGSADVFASAATGYNYSGAGIDFGSSETAASITAVGGLVQAGKSNIGASIVVTDISRSHDATINGVDIRAGSGSVDVAATDGARIASVAVGVGLAVGTFAGQASVVTNHIANSTTAVIGAAASTPATTLVDASQVNVRAANTAAIRTAAGSLAVNLKSSAVGVSAVNSNIANTTTAKVRGAKVSSNSDVVIDAASSARINATAIGAAASAGSGFGAAGSLSTNIMGNDVTARITGGADVDADNNVAVTAANSDHISVIAGSLAASAEAAGVGASVVVSKINGDTVAEVNGTGTTVDARGANTASMLSVDSGTLASPLDLGSYNAPTDQTPDLSESKKQLNGLAVKATSGQAVVANAVTAAFSPTVAVALTSITNDLGGETRGAIDGVDINQSLTLGDTPDVFVGASSHSYAGTFAVSAGTLSTNIVKRTTLARVSGANVKAPGHMDVDAKSSAGASSIVASVALANGETSVGLAGAGIVNVFKGTTRSVLNSGMTEAGDLSVTADNKNGFASAAGTLAVAGKAAIGGAVVVAVSESTTEALVGASGNRTQINLTGGLNVAANSSGEDKTIAVSAVGGGGVSVAGMLNVAVYNNTTAATLQSVDLNQPSSGTGAQSVNVTANETIDIEAYVGGAALGAKGGVGAAASAIQFKSSVSAGAIDSNLNVIGAVAVNAASDKDVYNLTFTGGIGGTVGIGASVGVILIGDEVANTDVADQLDAGGNGTLSAADEITNTGSEPVSVKAALGGAADDAVTAEITGGNVKADSITVDADSTVSTQNIAAGVGLGGKAGVGAGIGVSTVKSTVVASVSQGTVSARTLDVRAGLKDGSHRAAEVQGIAGGGGLYFGLGAAVAIAKTDNSVTAVLGGNVTGTGVSNATVSAKDESGVKAMGVGVAAGAVGIGASYVRATKSSTVAARIAANTNISGYNTLDISALGKGNLDGEAYAGAAGVAAGAGADVEATDNSNISAIVAANSSLTTGAGGLEITATGTPDVSADAFGVAVAAGGAVGVSLADATANQAITAGVDDSVVLIGGPLDVKAELNQNGGNESASASSVAGTGALLLGISAALSTARSSGTVKAYLGNNVQLPNGDVSITTRAVTHQDATSTGVGVGGLAFGAAGSTSESNVNSQVVVGTDTVSLLTRTGDIDIAAFGEDTNTADSTAGAGGILAGASSSSSTKDTSKATVDIGARSRLIGDRVAISARHNDVYKGETNSINASVAGASGAHTTHNATIDTTVTIRDHVYIDSMGGDKMQITARSDFTQSGTADSAKGGAGGIYSGSSVSSVANIVANTKVLTEDHVVMQSGSDPARSAGGIEMSAATFITNDDNVSLTTGGAITNASVKSNLIATVNNTVDIGTDNLWSTAGVVDVNTYTIANINNDAGVSTYGLAAVGRADALSQVTANQVVNVGTRTLLRGLDVVNLTPGKSGDGSNTSLLSTNARATGYVRGLIAVPDATAQSYAYSNATVTVAQGARIESARNVVVGGYTGTILTESYGKGKGYQLGFIPTSSTDSRRNSSSNATVNINGDLTAGLYHTLDLEIGCGAGVTCGANTAPVVRQNSGAPVLFQIDPAFNSHAYLDANFDPDVAAVLKNGFSGSNVNAVYLSQLFAAGGTVTIHADDINGAGNVASYGGPTVTLNNNSAAYLILDGGAYIPDTPGGEVLFTGAAGRAQNGSLDLTEESGNGPSIIINNNYAGAPVGNVDFGPGMLLTGDITNIGGGVAITNKTGSIGQTRNINAQQVNVTAPEGVFGVSATDPGGLYQPGASPFAEWRNAMYLPGLNPADGVPDALEGVIYAINKMHGGSNRNALNQNVYSNSASTINRSYVYFGACGVPDMGNCSTGFASAQIPNSYYETPLQYIPITGITVDWWNLSSQSDYSLIPYRTTANRSLTYASADTSGSANSIGIYGAGQVAIKASVININGRIEAGRKTDWSVDLGASAQAQIDYWKGVKASQPWRTGTVDLTGHTTTTRSGDAKISARYDVGRDAIILDDVNASSGGGNILLDGRIINTSKLYGHIHVNGGLGDVEINNNTSAKVIVGKINTGSLDEGSVPVSKIKIVDRLKSNASNTTTFLYNPAGGLKTYVTGHGADPVLSGPGATPTVGPTGGTATSYNPVTGTRFEWTLRAQLERHIQTYRSNGNIQDVSNWAWSSGTATNPWEYRGANSSGTGYSGLVPDSSPQGILVNRPGGADFEQTTSASRSNTSVGLFRYHGCVLGIACNYGFRQTGEHDPSPHRNDPYGEWLYYMPKRITLEVKNSVKADNSFGIDFDGNAIGSVKVNSSSNVTFRGDVRNSSGAASITSTAGSVVQWNGSTLLTKTADINAARNIGTKSNAFRMTLTNNGNISARGGKQGVHLDINSGAKIGTVRAKTGGTFGDVSIKAANDLKVGTGTGGVNVIGRDVTISSAGGAIGQGAGKPLVISAHGVRLPDGAEDKGVVSLEALRDISVRETGSGDMRLERAHSQIGDVTLHAVNGGIIDVRDQTSSTGITAAQLAEVSRRLSLTAADGATANATATSVTSFENAVNSSYVRYFRFLDDGAVTGATYVLDAGKLDLYRPIAKQALGLAGSPTDAQVRDFANQQYQAVTENFVNAYGSGWATLAQFQTQDTGFKFTATQAQADARVKDAVWSEGQLASAIDASALQPSSGAVGNADPLIVGRDVTLTAQGNIGSLADPVAIDIDDLQDGTLTDAQRAALAVASAPGSVLGVGDNGVKGYELLNLPAGVSLAGIEVSQTAPTFINATGTFRASATGDVFVQSTPGPQTAGATITIGQINAGGDVGLAAPAAILGAVASASTGIEAVQINAGGDLSLTAGTGNLGTSAVPITFRIGGRLISTSAGQDAHLRTDDRDMIVGRVFAQSTVSLTADAGNISSYLAGVAIAGQDISLVASGNAGVNGAALELQHASSGSLTGTIGGEANIYSPTLAGQANVTLNVVNFQAATATFTADRNVALSQVSTTTGDLTAAAGADLSIDNVNSAADVIATAVNNMDAQDVTSVGKVDFNAGGIVAIAGASASINAGTTAKIRGGSLQMADGSGLLATGLIDIETTGVATIGELRTTQTSAAPIAGITVTADRIASSTTSLANLDTTSANIQAILRAANGIGALTRPISVKGPTITASTTNGGIFIQGFGTSPLSATSLNAGGNIVATAQGDVTIGSATSTSGSVSMTARDRLQATTVTAGTTIAATSNAADILIGTATSGGNQTLTAQTGIAFNALTSTGGSITATTASGNILGPDVSAGANANLTATTGAITVANLTTGGAASATARGQIDLSTVNAGTTFAATSNAADILIGTATSGGNQTLSARSGIAFTALTSTGGSITATTASGNILGPDVSAGANANLTATTGAITVANLTSGGAASATARGQIDLSTVNAGTTFAATSNAANIKIDTATSGGNQTLSARSGIAFTALTSTGGSITAKTVTGNILGPDVSAGTNANLTATTGAITVANLTTGGPASATAQRQISLTTVKSGATFTATSKIASINIDTANSRGSQNLTARSGIAFNALTSLRGGITATTAIGGISGQTANARTHATLTATGSAITIGNLKVRAGGSTLDARKDITIDTGRVADNANLTSKAGNLQLGRITTGRSQILTAARALNFDVLNAGVDIIGTTGGDIDGNELVAGRNIILNGQSIRVDTASAGNDMTINARKDIAAGSLKAGNRLLISARGGNVSAGSLDAASMSLEAGGQLVLDLVSVEDALSLKANEVIANIRQSRNVPAGQPLQLSIIGSNGLTAQSAELDIDAPNGVILPMFYVDDSTIHTNAGNVAFEDAIIPGTMFLVTAGQSIFLDNQSGAPTARANVQLFEPGQAFALAVAGNQVLTTTYVVEYGTGAEVISDSYNSAHNPGARYIGTSMVREFVRQMRNGNAIDEEASRGPGAATQVIDPKGNPPPVDDSEGGGMAFVGKQGAGSAVNTGF